MSIDAATFGLRPSAAKAPPPLMPGSRSVPPRHYTFQVPDDLRRKEEGPLQAKPEPPVVARLGVEIRSDGSHTIARGAAEDMSTGERVSIQAEGATPLGLALSLLKSALELPALARTFARGLLPPMKKK